MAENEPIAKGSQRSASMLRAALLVLGGLVVGALIVAGLGLGRMLERPDPESVVSASLQSMREQSRLVPFTARFVAVITSTQSRFGISASKTLIMPGTVRYELDLARLGREDLAWDAAEQTLTVRLPPLQVSEPEIDLRELREYGEGGVMVALTGGEERLDRANRARGRQELVRQAQDPVPMRLARDAARRAIERSFVLPLQAAGIEAEVVARFPEEGTDDPSELDRSRRVDDVLRERREAR